MKESVIDCNVMVNDITMRENEVYGQEIMVEKKNRRRDEDDDEKKRKEEEKRKRMKNKEDEDIFGSLSFT